MTKMYVVMSEYQDVWWDTFSLTAEKCVEKIIKQYPDLHLKDGIPFGFTVLEFDCDIEGGVYVEGFRKGEKYSGQQKYRDGKVWIQ